MSNEQSEDRKNQEYCPLLCFFDSLCLCRTPHSYSNCNQRDRRCDQKHDRQPTRCGKEQIITQNVEYLLDSVQASTMLSNSEFLVMLSQAASDREKLAKLLNISREQMSYVTNADAGCGLIRYGSALVPFVNRFPRDTKLYALMTTKPGEGVFGGEEVLV